MKKEWKWGLFYGITVLTLLISVKSASNVITAMAENEPPHLQHCIVIDPGHGGEDGGAVSVTSAPESEYNLQIALRLRDMLSLFGYQTQMIRTEDVSVYTKGETLSQKKASDLKQRAKIASETQGAVLVSIHQNHFPDPDLEGAQVFYADTEGSEVLAKILQALLVSSVNRGSNRQVKQCSGVYLMSHIDCPAVLVECGFLSNPLEERRLRDPDYQKQLSSVIAAGICQFLSNT